MVDANLLARAPRLPTDRGTNYMTPSMDIPLLALRTGRMSMSTFKKRTHRVWLNIARSLLRRWRGPVAVDVDDVCQELLLNAWIFSGHWDSKLDVTITRFVTYNAIDKAKKWLHQQRNAYRRDDSAAARFDRPISSLNLSEYAEEHLLDSLAVPADAEEAYAQRQALCAAALRAPDQHLPAMVALARTGDIDLAAQALKESTAACVALRLTSIDDARVAIKRALTAVA